MHQSQLQIAKYDKTNVLTMPASQIQISMATELAYLDQGQHSTPQGLDSDQNLPIHECYNLGMLMFEWQI